MLSVDDEKSLTQGHLFNEPNRIPDQRFKTGISHLQSNLRPLIYPNQGKRIDRRGREEKRLSEEAERSADQINWENSGEGPPSTPRRVTRRQSRTSLTGREDEDAGGKAGRPRREDASPETWTG
ncbi:hypothetical protein Bca52824_056608 [Brassica carinata]|uniref:Uncharacterized protein n=1 Tax=Brassica carinata TaxID=52824 RepID=A0A8X7QUP3_BRACI|nr:hypothetical protein Bca52824_056608 [Brassica carinata]